MRHQFVAQWSENTHANNFLQTEWGVFRNLYACTYKYIFAITKIYLFFKGKKSLKFKGEWEGVMGSLEGGKRRKKYN